MKFYDIEQGSEEWFNLRLGKITSSHYSDIMAFTDGTKIEAKWGKGAIDYAQRIALERKTGKQIESFQSDWMKQGNENEPIARAKYECKTFQIVSNGGLFIDGEYGTSPDGLIDDGGIEIKCVKHNTHFETIKRSSADPSYHWQYQGQMFVAKLSFVDYVEYCDIFPPETELIIHRVERNDDAIKFLKERLELFKKLVYDYEKIIG